MLKINFIFFNFSCDDTAVALVDSEKRILKSFCINDKSSITKMGGIHPQHFANQVKNNLKIKYY